MSKHVQTYTTKGLAAGLQVKAAARTSGTFAVKRRDATHFQTGL
jgi:hypothetical protein